MVPSRRLALALFALLLTAASLRPVRSYDFFWHLATGRWIAEHHALPLNDPFGVASDRGPWINDEWLFELPLWGVWSVGGPAIAGLVRAAAVAAIFTLGAAAATEVSVAAAITIAAIGWIGGHDLLGERPATIGVLLFLLVLRLNLRPRTRSLPWKQALVTVLWINIHPSALLSPILALLFGAGSIAEQPEERRREMVSRLQAATLSAAALMVSPFGISAVTAPIRLMGSIRSGGFVNREWLPTMPAAFPLFYLTIGGVAVLLMASRRGEGRLPRAVMALFLMVLAVRFVRNQPFWFAALAPLTVPSLPAIRPALQRLLLAATTIVLLTAMAASQPQPGIDERYFPVSAVRQLSSMKTRGAIFNADQFGGYLIWSFYPERRALLDGRNELYGTYLQEYEKARRDSREWDRLIAKYKVEVALDEYHAETIDVIDPRSGAHAAVPASLVFFPRQEWALVAFDDVAMVFIRRGSGNAIPFEYRELVPDDPDPRWKTVAGRALAARELEVARRRSGECWRIEKLAAALAK
jgi:hypothetical protein